MVEAFHLDQLFAADVSGVYRWILRVGAEWYLGDIIGGSFADAVDQNWTILQYGTYHEWA